MSSDPILFDTNGFYLLLTDIGAEMQFHWGLYLAKAPSHGITFHLINGPHTGNTWKYQSKTTHNVPSSVNLLVAIKIAVIDPALHTDLARKLAELPVTTSSRYGPITCRVWVKEALHELDDEGYIAIKPEHTVDDIELEAVQLAAGNKMAATRSVVKSPLSKA
ncbi:hypothetical protein DV735_g2000, partial [Chaetothyriales sp. CBS 134920]